MHVRGQGQIPCPFPTALATDIGIDHQEVLPSCTPRRQAQLEMDEANELLTFTLHLCNDRMDSLCRCASALRFTQAAT